jgi:hypothetical protein
VPGGRYRRAVLPLPRAFAMILLQNSISPSSTIAGGTGESSSVTNRI